MNFHICNISAQLKFGFDYLTTRQLLYVAESHVSRFLNLNVSVTNRDAAPKQRYNRFPSVGDHIHATTTLSRPGYATTYYYKRFLEI